MRSQSPKNCGAIKSKTDLEPPDDPQQAAGREVLILLEPGPVGSLFLTPSVTGVMPMVTLAPGPADRQVSVWVCPEVSEPYQVTAHIEAAHTP
jgi:hypothetical protein